VVGPQPAGAPCPQRMAPEWLAANGRLQCRRCGQAVGSGELFFLTSYCSMGGVVDLGGAAWLYSDTLENFAEHLRCLPPAVGEPRCLTVGHGTRPIEELTTLLREHGVQILADIRTVPRSRKNPQYERAALRERLRSEGLCYLHLPELGGLRRPRRDSPNAGWRNDSFRGYADYMLTSTFAAALEELTALLGQRATAIMCAETVQWRCHRSLVADALLVRGIPAFHILGSGPPVPHRLAAFARVVEGRLLYPPGDDGTDRTDQSDPTDL
jgi:hypothetical protein